MYAKCGCIEKSSKNFNGLKEKDTCNTPFFVNKTHTSNNVESFSFCISQRWKVG